MWILCQMASNHLAINKYEMVAHYFIINTVDGRINPKRIIHGFKEALDIVSLHVRRQDVTLSEDGKNVVLCHPLQPCHIKKRIKACLGNFL